MNFVLDGWEYRIETELATYPVKGHLSAAGAYWNSAKKVWMCRENAIPAVQKVLEPLLLQTAPVQQFTPTPGWTNLAISAPQPSQNEPELPPVPESWGLPMSSTPQPSVQNRAPGSDWCSTHGYPRPSEWVETGAEINWVTPKKCSLCRATSHVTVVCPSRCTACKNHRPHLQGTCEHSKNLKSARWKMLAGSTTARCVCREADGYLCCGCRVACCDKVIEQHCVCLFSYSCPAHNTGQCCYGTHD